MTAFEELLQLARFLYDYRCSITPFHDFALSVREYNARFETDVEDNKNSRGWAFISFVFGWEEHFVRTALGVPCLGLADNTQHAGGAGHGLPLDERALREVFRKSHEHRPRLA